MGSLGDWSSPFFIGAVPWPVAAPPLPSISLPAPVTLPVPVSPGIAAIRVGIAAAGVNKVHWDLARLQVLGC